MPAQALGQISAAAWTRVAETPEDVRAEFFLAETRVTRDAPRNTVIPAVPIEQHTLVAAQAARPLAIIVDDVATMKLDTVIGGHHPAAP